MEEVRRSIKGHSIVNDFGYRKNIIFYLESWRWFELNFIELFLTTTDENFELYVTRE